MFIEIIQFLLLTQKALLFILVLFSANIILRNDSLSATTGMPWKQLQMLFAREFPSP